MEETEVRNARSFMDGYQAGKQSLKEMCLEGEENWRKFLDEFQGDFALVSHDLSGSTPPIPDIQGRSVGMLAFGDLQIRQERINHLLVHTYALGDQTLPDATPLPKSVTSAGFFENLQILFQRMQESGELRAREEIFRRDAEEQASLLSGNGLSKMHDVPNLQHNDILLRTLDDLLQKEQADPSSSEAKVASAAAQRLMQYQDAARHLSDRLHSRLIEIGDQFRPWYEVPEKVSALMPVKTRIPARQAQQTGQMTRTLNAALGDAPKLHRWQVIEGENALRHVIPGWPMETVLTTRQTLSWWGHPESTTALQEELKQIGIEAVFLVNVLTGLCLKEGQVTISMPELCRAIGRGDEARRSAKHRARVERDVWRSVLIFDALAVVGKLIGKYRERDTREVMDVTMSGMEAIIKITGITPGQLSSDGSAPPALFSYVCGPWIDQMRNNAQVMTYFGDIMRLACIPPGQPSGAWAKSIGLNLNQRWRDWGHDAKIRNAGDENRLTTQFAKHFTRQDLLLGKDLYRASPDAEDILTSTDPGRAKEYWDQAISILREKNGVNLISYYAECIPATTARKGWQKDWLDQPLDIRPSMEAMQDVANLARSHKQARRRRTAPKTAH